MPVLKAVEAERRKGAARPVEIAADCQRHLLARALAHHVAARVLRQISAPALTANGSAGRLKQAGEDLRQRCLPGSVRADQGDDLAPPQLKRCPGKHRWAPRIGKTDPVETAYRLASSGRRVDALRQREVGRVVLLEPGERVIGGRVEYQPT